MDRKTISGIFLILSILLIIASVFAQQELFQATPSDKIACGNNVCEEMTVNFKVGNEKRIQLGEKSYTFKLIRIEKIQRPYDVIDPDGVKHVEYNYEYKPYLSIDGGPVQTEEEIRQSLKLGGSGFSMQAMYSEYGQEANEITIRAQESYICMVPDCGKSVELNIFKRWNLVPLYFFVSELSKQRNNMGEPFEDSTCKLINFPVIYGYDPVKKEYVRLYLFGMSIDQFQRSLDEFANRNQEARIFTGLPFNAVWVYSDSGCKLATQLPKPFADNFLYIIAAMTQTGSYGSAPRAPTPIAPGPPVVEVEIPQEIVQEQPIEETAVSQERAVSTQGKQTARAPVKLLLQSQGDMVFFAAGWNFFMSTNDMSAKTLDGIRGNCTIQRAYTFDAENQSWTKITTAPSLGQAFIFKVTQPCMFGFPDIAPPTLPVGDIPLAVRK